MHGTRVDKHHTYHAKSFMISHSCIPQKSNSSIFLTRIATALRQPSHSELSRLASYRWSIDSRKWMHTYKVDRPVNDPKVSGMEPVSAFTERYLHGQRDTEPPRKQNPIFENFENVIWLHHCIVYEGELHSSCSSFFACPIKTTPNMYQIWKTSVGLLPPTTCPSVVRWSHVDSFINGTPSKFKYHPILLTSKWFNATTVGTVAVVFTYFRQ